MRRRGITAAAEETGRMSALGMIETRGLAAAVEALDAMGGALGGFTAGAVAAPPVSIASDRPGRSRSAWQGRVSE